MFVVACFHEKPYELLHILNQDVDEQDQKIRRLISKPRCPKCFDVFTACMHASLVEEPKLDIHEMREDMVKQTKEVISEPIDPLK